MSVAVSKMGVFLSSLKWKVSEQYWRDILQSLQMLAAIKHVVDDNTVQQLLRNTQLYFFWAMAQPARAELNWLQDLGSPQQREYKLQVNKIEEIN